VLTGLVVSIYYLLAKPGELPLICADVSFALSSKRADRNRFR
jgi:hypothetical protein